MTGSTLLATPVPQNRFCHTKAISPQIFLYLTHFFNTIAVAWLSNGGSLKKKWHRLIDWVDRDSLRRQSQALPIHLLRCSSKLCNAVGTSDMRFTIHGGNGDGGTSKPVKQAAAALEKPTGARYPLNDHLTIDYG